MFNSVACEFPYSQTLCLRPGGELIYRYRLAPEDKKKSSGNGIRQASSYVPDGVFCVSDNKIVSFKKRGKRSAAPSPLAIDENSTRKFSHPKLGRPGFGVLPVSHPFSGRARRSLRWGAAALEQKFGKDRLWFLTGTLPGSTDEAIKVFASWSSWFLDCLNKWLSKNFSLDGRCYRLSCWELQKRGALHLHVLIATDDDSITWRFQDEWVRLLNTVSAVSGVDLYAKRGGGSWRSSLYRPLAKPKYNQVALIDVIAYAQPVYKSVTAYLSKYLSKDSSKTSDSCSPARWWSMSRVVRDTISEYTISINLPRANSDEIETIKAFIQSVLSGCSSAWGNTIRTIHSAINSPPLDLHIGFVGWLPSWDDSVKLIVDSSKLIDSCLSRQNQSQLRRFHVRRLHDRVSSIQSAERINAAWELIDNPWLQKDIVQNQIRARYPGKPTLTINESPLPVSDFFNQLSFEI